MSQIVTVPVRRVVPDRQLTVAHALANLLSGKKAESNTTRLKGLKSFTAWWGKADVLAACCEFVSLGRPHAVNLAKRWKHEMYEAGVAVNTINSRLQALRRLVAECHEIEVIPWTLKVKGYKSVAYRDTRGCGRDGWIKLRKHLSKLTDPAGRRDYAMVRCMWDYGLRCYEVWQLDVESIVLKTGIVRLTGKARDQDEPLILPKPTLQAIRAWLDVRGSNPGPLFIGLSRLNGGGRLNRGSIRRIVKLRGAEAGVTALHPHALRHAVGTDLLAQGNPIHEVAKFMRHGSVEVTMRYFDNYQGVGDSLAAKAARR